MAPKPAFFGIIGVGKGEFWVECLQSQSGSLSRTRRPGQSPYGSLSRSRDSAATATDLNSVPLGSLDYEHLMNYFESLKESAA